MTVKQLGRAAHVLPLVLSSTLAGCATTESTISPRAAELAVARWEYVAAGERDELGNALPAHVRVPGLRFEWYGVARTRMDPGAEGRLLLFCDRSEMRYEFGEALRSPDLLHAWFQVRRLQYDLGEYVPSDDYVPLYRGQAAGGFSHFPGGSWASEGPLWTAAFVDAALQGAQVDVTIAPRPRAATVGSEVNLVSPPERHTSIAAGEIAARSISHRFSLLGFASALAQCDAA